MSNEHLDWWASLKHGGLLIAPSKLAEYFPKEPEPLWSRDIERLRRDLTRLETGSSDAERVFLETVLVNVCGVNGDGGGQWERGPEVKTDWSRRSLTGEIVKPRWLWHGRHGSHFPVFVDTQVSRIGVGRGRRSVSRVVEWLRGADQKLAILTNLRQWRLIFAGLDFEAWAEWDTELWLEGPGVGPQVTALRTLISEDTLTAPKEDEPGRLLAAIQASRKGQAELSSELGERVRQAVELLIRQHGPGLHTLVEEGKATPTAIYIAATRIVMRMVVVLFTEARELLPRDEPVYNASYSLQGLREILDRAGGAAGLPRLRHRFGTWPRILALFRLVYEGSHHPELSVPRYGGDLFAPGDPRGFDPVRRTLAVFEDPEHAPSDAVVYQVLNYLCRCRIKVRQGRGSTWVDAPVDFSDLSSEYIGILYEGLLNYELRRVGNDDPVVFLALGDEPALPLSRLESMDDKAIASLVEKARKGSALKATEEEGGEDDEAEEEDPDEEVLAAGDSSDETDKEEEITEEEPLAIDEAGDDDVRQRARERAQAWAKKAVIVGKLVGKARSRKGPALRAHEELVERTAGNLIKNTVLPGEWYLVRFGGTRKGTGTFYTRPQLAVPTVQRTIRPLAYDPPLKAGGEPNEDAPAPDWTPKKPEEILALKICDPACGSGSFLIASLRFLTDALVESLYHHGRIESQGESTLVTLAEGKPSEGRLSEELLPRPLDAEDFDEMLRARLKRYVVELCIYGVDIDPLAVELCRLSLWVETMDRLLPFSFLDHKIKCGNSLVGCWFDRFRDYPALAWEREGGDKNHTKGVHFEKETWTKAIREFRKELRPALADWIAGQHSLFDKVEGRTPEEIHDDALALLERMHAFKIQETQERADFYRDKVQSSSALESLKGAFDTWCALWFWPADRLDAALVPRNFGNRSPEANDLVRELALEYRFFHWELEFPDVFAVPGGGFDVIVGNPPWEIQKPNSKEFFSNIDPLYRGYGKQEALNKQEEYFKAASADERRWLLYNARFKALSNWNKHVGSPFGSGEDGGGKFSLGAASGSLHLAWLSRRDRYKVYADREHPFRWQGSADINTYKMFLETGHALIRDGGYIGLLVPSGVYTDKGSTDLRELFLTRCRWRWLFGFENRDGIFDIHRSFKFCPVIVEKGGTTDAIQTAFMHRDVSDWEDAEKHVFLMPTEAIRRISPQSLSFLEFRSSSDLGIILGMQESGQPLRELVSFTQQFDMTTDSGLFPPLTEWEKKGFEPNEYGVWQDSRKRKALSVFEGRMVGQFDPSAKRWVSGKGRTAKWDEVPWEHKLLHPQYLMSAEDYLSSEHRHSGYVLAYMKISSATNTRTFIGTIVRDLPSVYSLCLLTSKAFDLADWLRLSAFLNSFVYDFGLRHRLGGLNVTGYVLGDTMIPDPRLREAHSLALPVAKLSFPHVRFGVEWFWLSTSSKRLKNARAWRSTWAITPSERLRLRCLVDVVIVELYGLEWDQLAHVLEGCDLPVKILRDAQVARNLNPKGFWRVDKDKDPELRHTVLTLAAFQDLKETIAQHGGDRNRGIEAFCNMNDGDGWQLPETLCLADLGLGHDDRAKKPQPVRSRLGERFLPWQLEQSVEESWAECEIHARNILGEEGFEKLKRDLERGQYSEVEEVPVAAEGPRQYGENDRQRKLL